MSTETEQLELRAQVCRLEQHVLQAQTTILRLNDQFDKAYDFHKACISAMEKFAAEILELRQKVQALESRPIGYGGRINN